MMCLLLGCVIFLCFMLNLSFFLSSDVFSMCLRTLVIWTNIIRKFGKNGFGEPPYPHNPPKKTPNFGPLTFWKNLKNIFSKFLTKTSLHTNTQNKFWKLLTNFPTLWINPPFVFSKNKNYCTKIRAILIFCNIFDWFHGPWAKYQYIKQIFQAAATHQLSSACEAQYKPQNISVFI
jgi:hypothetical protein